MYMATPRKSTVIKGYRIGTGTKTAPKLAPYPAQLVADPARPRHVLDYVLARRAVLEEIKRNALLIEQICDADPYLLRAAKYHGEQTERPCPVCRKSELVHVTYVYGDDLGYQSGRVRSAKEVTEMAFEFGHFQVYVVEVCQRCSWNHLYLSYALGDGNPRPIPRTPRDVLE